MKKTIALILVGVMLLLCLMACNMGKKDDVKRAEEAIAAYNKGNYDMSDSYDGEASEEDLRENEEWLSEIMGKDVKLAYMATYGMDDITIWVFESSADAEKLLELFEDDGMGQFAYQDGAIFIYADTDHIAVFSDLLK